MGNDRHRVTNSMKKLPLNAPRIPASSGSRESPDVKKAVLNCFTNAALGLKLIDPGQLLIGQSSRSVFAATGQLPFEKHIHIIIGPAPTRSLYDRAGICHPGPDP